MADDLLVAGVHPPTTATAGSSIQQHQQQQQRPARVRRGGGAGGEGEEIIEGKGLRAALALAAGRGLCGGCAAAALPAASPEHSARDCPCWHLARVLGTPGTASNRATSGRWRFGAARRAKPDD
jgi:hypothetical protein